MLGLGTADDAAFRRAVGALAGVLREVTAAGGYSRSSCATRRRAASVTEPESEG